MRNIVIKLVTILLAQGIATAHASDVRVGVTVSGEIRPGVYGRVDIGNQPPPVVYTQPVIITQPARAVAATPVYMHVPPGHAKNWRKHCHKYNACGEPVYFVKSEEYESGHRHGKEKKHGGRHHRD